MPEADAPSWLDAAFVQEVFRRDGGDDADAVVTSVSLKTVGVGGDHYASTMYRITAETTNGVRSLIAKTMPPGEVFRTAMREGGIFETEAKVLADIVPKMQKMLEDAAPGRFPPLCARCPHHGDEPEDFLVLQDLAPQGFRLADRHRGLGLRHSLLALRTLARFHAASAALLAQDPTLPNKVPTPYRKIGAENFEPFITSAFQMVADASRKWQDFPSKYADALEEIKGGAYSKYASIHDYRPGRFNVLSHGDFWLNNMMFRYEDDQVSDIRLVDLQVSHVTTPAVDILYFLHTSVSEDVSKHHTDLLIREYHVSLVETMQLLGLEPPSLNDILAEIEEFGFWATFSALCVLPIVKTREVPDLEKSIGDQAEENNFMYTSPVMERWFRRLLPELDRKGLLSLKAVEC